METIDNYALKRICIKDLTIPSYEYTEEEVNKIFLEIDKQLKFTKSKFLSGKRERFKL